VISKHVQCSQPSLRDLREQVVTPLPANGGPIADVTGKDHKILTNGFEGPRCHFEVQIRKNS
jgi:hypothetical protein